MYNGLFGCPSVILETLQIGSAQLSYSSLIRQEFLSWVGQIFKFPGSLRHLSPYADSRQSSCKDFFNTHYNYLQRRKGKRDNKKQDVT